MDNTNTKLLSPNHLWKILLASFLLALLVSTSTLLIYRNNKDSIFPTNNAKNSVDEGIDKIQWEFASGLSLSNQLNEEINKLLFFEIQVGYRIENPTGGYHYHSIEGIDYNVIEIEAWLYDDDVTIEDGGIGEIQRPISGSWRLTIISAIPEDRSIDPTNCPSDLFCGPPIIELNETENMNQLYSSFTLDIANIGNFANVTNNGDEEVALLNSEIEVLYWRISHVYKDGTFMEFYLFDDIMIIRYTSLEIFLIKEGGVAYGPIYNNTNSISFKATIEGPVLPNYLDGINSLLTTVINRR